MLDTSTRADREKLVLDHFHDEVVQKWDDVLSTFPHPRYEIIPLMRVHDGDTEVRGYYYESRTAFPDQDHEIIALRHTDDAVVVEFWLTGTHRGPFGPIPPTGNKFRVRMTAFFIFDQQEKLVCERIYFDALTMFKQLMAGKSVKNPRDWPFFVKAVRGLMAVSGDQPDPDLINTPVAQFPGYVHKPAAERV